MSPHAYGDVSAIVQGACLVCQHRQTVKSHIGGQSTRLLHICKHPELCGEWSGGMVIEDSGETPPHWCPLLEKRGA